MKISYLQLPVVNFHTAELKKDHMIDKVEDRVKHAFNKYNDVLIMWLKNVNDGHLSDFGTIFQALTEV
jgi:hypothetical protein